VELEGFGCGLADSREDVLSEARFRTMETNLDELLGDPRRAKVMGDRAREIARTTYSQDAAAAKLETFYRNTMAASAARQ